MDTLEATLNVPIFMKLGQYVYLDDPDVKLTAGLQYFQCFD
jgi:hypothetical protein